MSSNFIRPGSHLSFFLGASTASTAVVLALPVIYFFGRNQSPPTSSDTCLCSTELNDDARKGDCEWNRAVDLSKFFIRWGRKYLSDRRRLEEERSRKSQTCRGSNTPNTRQIQDAFEVLTEIPVVLRPLAPEVRTLLQKYGCERDCLSSSSNDDKVSPIFRVSRTIFQPLGPSEQFLSAKRPTYS
ncbi:hypothetical protein A7C99_4963 [Trichophyton rubrum]|uniref:Uncharacterized protein n=1 Tax=Trichophyton rubrum TaxID=5551 RepID=A0A178ERB0_TRIRU|nr:hypothetical protein A7C99_4963 [Trichophyton rubrum]